MNEKKQPRREMKQMKEPGVEFKLVCLPLKPTTPFLWSKALHFQESCKKFANLNALDMFHNGYICLLNFLYQLPTAYFQISKQPGSC